MRVDAAALRSLMRAVDLSSSNPIVVSIRGDVESASAICADPNDAKSVSFQLFVLCLFHFIFFNCRRAHSARNRNPRYVVG